MCGSILHGSEVLPPSTFIHFVPFIWPRCGHIFGYLVFPIWAISMERLVRREHRESVTKRPCRPGREGAVRKDMFFCEKWINRVRYGLIRLFFVQNVPMCGNFTANFSQKEARFALPQRVDMRIIPPRLAKQDEVAPSIFGEYVCRRWRTSRRNVFQSYPV